jgi:hypothetical protein
MTPQLAAPETISRVDIFRRRALKIVRPIPGSPPATSCRLDREGRPARRGASAGMALWALIGYNPVLVL